MLAVLMSMKPEWWEKILDGEKTLEIRKTHPQNERLEWPVTVLVYVSGTGAVQGQFLCPGCESIVETEKKMTKGARREIVRCEQTDRTLLRDLPSQ